MYGLLNRCPQAGFDPLLTKWTVLLPNTLETKLPRLDKLYELCDLKKLWNFFLEPRRKLLHSNHERSSRQIGFGLLRKHSTSRSLLQIAKWPHQMFERSGVHQRRGGNVTFIEKELSTNSEGSFWNMSVSLSMSLSILLWT